MKEEMGFKLSERFLLLAESRLPKPVCRHRFGGGWPRASDRHMLHAIFFVLRAGCQWKALDATTYGSGSTAHRRFQQWNGTGVFLRLWRACARQYDEINGIDWRWLAIDGA